VHFKTQGLLAYLLKIKLATTNKLIDPLCKRYAVLLLKQQQIVNTKFQVIFEKIILSFTVLVHYQTLFSFILVESTTFLTNFCYNFYYNKTTLTGLKNPSVGLILLIVIFCVLSQILTDSRLIFMMATKMIQFAMFKFLFYLTK